MVNRLALRTLILEELETTEWNIVSEGSSFGEYRLLSEGIGFELLKDVAQFVVAALVEYGSMIGAAGAGAAGPSEMVETVVDLFFLGESAASVTNALVNVASVSQDLATIYNEGKKLFSLIPESLDKFYNSVKKIVATVMKRLGDGAEEAVEEIRTSIQKLLDKCANAVGDGIKAIIPDALVGTSVGESVFAIIDAVIRGASSNCYDLVAKAINATGKYKDWLLDPELALNFFDQNYPKLIEACEKLSEMLKNRNFAERAKTLAVGIATTGPLAGATKVGTMKGIEVGLPLFVQHLKSSQSYNRKALEGLLKTIIPGALLLLAIFQVLMSEDYKSTNAGDASVDKEQQTSTSSDQTIKSESRLSLLRIDERINFLESIEILSST